MKIVLMIKSGIVDVVECPEDVEIVLWDYDCCGNVNDNDDMHTDDLGDEYIECQLN